MVYDNIAIDSANLFYRLLGDNRSVRACTKSMIKFIDDTTMAHLSKDGTLYILFDPIPLSDLGESKSFKNVKPYRKEIDKDYKKGRTYSQYFPETMSLLLKYYAYRGEKIKLIYSQEYEADDYVSSLVKSLDGTVALVTTDEDYCRYMSDRVFIINKGYDQPMTKQDFYDKFKFYPTDASVTLYKAFFGDTSDNIQGAVFGRKVKFTTNIKKIVYNYIKEVSDNGWTLQECINKLAKTTFYDAMNAKTKDAFTVLFLELSCSQQKDEVYDKLMRNIKLIKSALEGKDISKLTHWNPVNEKMNSLVHQSIFGLDTKSWFGKK